ncbi:MAG: hypothetical protein V1776_04690 [Candidatus Diapherotrites archaeon]
MSKGSIKLLDKQIQKYRTKKKIIRERETKEDLILQKKENEFRANESKLLPKKIELYKKILSWRNKFKKSKQFKTIFGGDNEVEVFFYGWGHLNLESSYNGPTANVSKLFLNKSGKLEYEARHKMMSYPRIVLSSKTKTARKFTHEYLIELCRTIETGKIYKNISNEIAEQQKHL